MFIFWEGWFPVWCGGGGGGGGGLGTDIGDVNIGGGVTREFWDRYWEC